MLEIGTVRDPHLSPSLATLLARASTGGDGKIQVLAWVATRGGSTKRIVIKTYGESSAQSVLNAQHFAAAYQAALEIGRMTRKPTGGVLLAANPGFRRRYDIAFGGILGWDLLDELSSDTWCNETEDRWPHRGGLGGCQICGSKALIAPSKRRPVDERLRKK